MDDRFGYPAARARGGAPPLAPIPGFRGYESTSGYVAVTDAEADVIRFSGTVSRVEVAVELQDVTLRFTSRNADESSTLTLRAGQAQTLDVRCSVVRAANAVAGAAGRVSVLGYFEERAAHAPLVAAPDAP